MNTSWQIYEIMGCIYAGLILGAVYAAFDFLRIICRFGKVMGFITDIIYVLVCIIFSAFALYNLTYMRVALYHVVSIIAGIFTYVGSVHRTGIILVRSEE